MAVWGKNGCWLLALPSEALAKEGCWVILVSSLSFIVYRTSRFEFIVTG
jgi:hypothetical protein